MALVDMRKLEVRNSVAPSDRFNSSMRAYAASCVLLLTFCISISNAQFHDIIIDGNITANEWPPSLPVATGNWYVAMKQSVSSIFVAATWQTTSSGGDVFMLALEANPIPSNSNITRVITCRGQNVSLSFQATTYLCLNSTTQMLVYTYSTLWNLNGTTPFALRNTSGTATLEIEIPFALLNGTLVGDNTITLFGKVIGSVVTTSAPNPMASYNFYLSQTYGLASNFLGYYESFAYAQRSGPSWTTSSNWFQSRQPTPPLANKTNAILFADSGLATDVAVSHLLIYPGVELTLGAALTVQGNLGNIPPVIFIHTSSGVTTLNGGYLEIVNDEGVTPALLLSNNITGTHIGSVVLRGSGQLNNDAITVVIENQLTFLGGMAISNRVVYGTDATLIYKDVEIVRNEWPAISDASEVNENVPVNVLLSECQNCTLAIEDNMLLLTRGNFQATNSNLTVQSPDTSQGEKLGVMGYFSATNSTITLQTNLVVVGIISLDNYSSINCSSGQFFVQHNTSYSYFTMETTLNPSGGDSMILEEGGTYNYSVAFDVQVLTTGDFAAYEWDLNSTSVPSCSGHTTCTFSESTGNTTLQVKARHLASGCYSSLAFNVLYTGSASATLTSDSTTSTTSATSSGDHHPKSDDHAGLIAGVVIGGSVVIAASVLAGFFLVRRRRNGDNGNDVEMQGTSDWEIPFTELELGKELGRGAFGVVYKCRWRNTDCVAKQLDINRNDQQSIKQFLKEANNVKGLRPHPNVCNVFGICTDPNHPICIVMEYLPDGALDQLVYYKKISVNPKMILDFAKDIASGMSHIHQENVLHCDLACRNLLVTARGNNKYQVKIADFGLSRVTETDTYNASTNTSFPVRWTAPETLQSGKIARSSDVWSFGVVLWEIAEGKRPYTDLSNSEVIKAVCDRGVRLPRPDRVQIPDELWDLMNRCWDSEPQNRPSFNQIYSELCRIEEKHFGIQEEQDNNNNNLKNEDTDDNYNNSEIRQKQNLDYNTNRG